MIDQTNFKPTEVAHVWIDEVTNLFYFTDETTAACGPYNTMQEAATAVAEYAASLGIKMDTESTRVEIDKILTAESPDVLLQLLDDFACRHMAQLGAAARATREESLMAILVAECQKGQQLLPELFSTDTDAIIYLACEVLSAQIQHWAERDELKHILQDEMLRVHSLDDAKAVLMKHFIGQAFEPDPDDANLFRFNQIAADRIIDTPAELFEHLRLEAVRPTTADQIHPTQLDCTRKASTIISHLLAKVLQKHGRKMDEELVKLTQRIRFKMMQEMTEEQRYELFQSNALQSIAGGSEATQWIGTFLIANNCIDRDASVEAGPNQPWIWNEAGEAKVLQVLQDCI